MQAKPTALLVSATLLALPAAAHAGQRTEAELTHIARATTHGVLQDNQSIDLLERRYLTGERITVTCGTVSRLAVQRLHRLRVQARVVGTVTYDKPNGYDDGHIMIEVRNGSQWDVYDLDNNRQPVDKDGHGITVVQFAKMGHRYYRMLADDQPDWRRVPSVVRRHHDRLYSGVAGLERWYDHVLGAPLIMASPMVGAAVYMSQPMPVVHGRGWITRGYINLPASRWHALYA